jgi:hypothetical protein
MTDKEHVGPWVVRLVDACPLTQEKQTMYLASCKGISSTWTDLRHARRFEHKDCAARKAARYLLACPGSWGKIRIVRLVQKSVPSCV